MGAQGPDRSSALGRSAHTGRTSREGTCCLARTRAQPGPAGEPQTPSYVLRGAGSVAGSSAAQPSASGVPDETDGGESPEGFGGRLPLTGQERAGERHDPVRRRCGVRRSRTHRDDLTTGAAPLVEPDQRLQQLGGVRDAEPLRPGDARRPALPQVVAALVGQPDDTSAAVALQSRRDLVRDRLVRVVRLAWRGTSSPQSQHRQSALSPNALRSAIFCSLGARDQPAAGLPYRTLAAPAPTGNRSRSRSHAEEAEREVDEVVEDCVVAVRHETEQARGDEAEQTDSEVRHADHAARRGQAVPQCRPARRSRR